MKKVLRGIVIVALVLVTLFSLTACNKYKWGPVGGTEDADKEAVSNGSLAVQQGNYLYFVNNVADDSSLTKADNEFGANGVNGAIMKSKINADGTLECLGVVVPKMFVSDYSNAGIYVYGEWIYYVARSQQTDNKGNLLSSLEFMRTTIDGSKTQSIVVVEDLGTNYIFTKTGLLYTVNAEIHYVDCTAKKFPDTTVVTDYTDIQVSKEDLCMFYTKASDNEYVSANNLGVVLSDGSNKVIIAENAYAPADVDYKTNMSYQYTLDIIGYNAADNSIYYTKTCKDTDAAVSTVGYVIPEDYSFNKVEVKYANSALSSVYSLGVNVGLVDVSGTTLVAYAPMGDAIIEQKSDELTVTSSITILYQDGDYTYYLMSSLLYRADLFKNGTINTSAYEEKISEVKISVKYQNPSKLGDYLYYESSDDATYLYRLNISTYTSDTQDYIKGYIVSGYTTYTYPDDADYTINADDEEIKDKVPAYMTDDDLETYISNHKTTNE